MSDATATPPQLEQSTAISDSDHGMIVTVVCWLRLVASLLFFTARLRIRWPFKSFFGKDDTFCTAAMIVSIVQTALVMKSVDIGLGTKHEDLTASQITSIEKYLWTTDIIYVFSLCLSKGAIALLFRRFSASPERIRASKAFTISVVIYGFIGVLIASLRQNKLQPRTYNPTTADSTLYRWIAFGILGIILDIVALLFPFYLIWDLQMDRRSKSAIITAFALRAPTIVFNILRIVSISRLNAADFTYAYVQPEVFTQLEQHYSLIAATIPCLRIFLKSWNTSSLAMGLEDVDERAFVERKSIPQQAPTDAPNVYSTHLHQSHHPLNINRLPRIVRTFPHPPTNPLDKPANSPRVVALVLLPFGKLLRIQIQKQ